MKFLDTDIAPLGMGCWPIGGAMFSGTQPLGYSNTNDDESIRTIHAALDGGIRLFDTAAAYGAGHAERLLGRALKSRPEAVIVTKIGIAIDETTKQLIGDETEPASVIPAIDRCLRRLDREQIDILMFHQNGFPIHQAAEIFDEMDKARLEGKIKAYGWSTDFSASARAMAPQEGFAAVEYVVNLLIDAPKMQEVVAQHGLIALIRSPLAMGLLTGKYDANSIMPADDIRSTTNPKTDYFKDARANPIFLDRLNAVRDLLETGGRTITQGALCWLWAKSSSNIPIPGARNVDQIEGITQALGFGPLPITVMQEIEGLIGMPLTDAVDVAR